MANQEIVAEVPSFLGMSDEEMSKVDIGAVSLQASEAPVAAAASSDVDADEVIDPPVEGADADTADNTDADADDADDVPVDPAVTADDKEDKDKANDPPAVEVVAKDVSDAVKPEAAPDAIDYKAEYERLLAPFKANGRDIKVDNVDDAVTLMQMGANYNKKMAGLKPNLKLMKLLENNGLLSEEKLSYLIDLDKKDPAAIGKLLKDSKIDPLDFAEHTDKEYKPKKYAVDDLEMELDTVLDELQDTPTYNRTLDVVSNKWDGQSKQVIANSPQILKVINSHMQSGIYDQIQAEMESERVFGRLNGMSDIEAYRQVGDAIQARGGFDHLGHQGQQTTKQPVIVTPKPRQVDDDKLKEKRRAAGSSKPAGPTPVVQGFNPLALSDEAFEQQVLSKYS